MPMVRVLSLVVLFTAGPAAAQSLVSLSSQACLRKVALDLTGRAPTADELEALESGARSFDALIDGYLASPEFSQTAFEWFLVYFAPTQFTAADADVQEPARLAHHLVVEDRDFRELVTATYRIDARGSPVPGPPDAAGVLSTRAFLSSYRGLEWRGWASMVLRRFADVTLAPVTVSGEVDASREGLAANPVCAGCHQHPVYGLDKVGIFRDCYDREGHPIDGCTPVPTTFLGKSGATLPDLGRILAESQEWRSAMVRFFFARLFGRAMGKNETHFFWHAEDAWIRSGYRTRALVKSLVTLPEYCSR